MGEKMAKILVAFFNAIEDKKNPNALPLFYEAFIEGLDKFGNDIMLFSHKMFGLDFGEIDENTKNAIVEFKPDICFIFNNSFYDISEIVNCPIVIYEVDSPRYFSNKLSIQKKPDRYLYFIYQEDSRITLVNDYGVKEKQIFYVPFFSEIHADSAVEQTTNICFIGSLFAATSMGSFKLFLDGHPTREEWGMMNKCIEHLRKHPQVTPTDLVYNYNITSELVAKSLNLPAMLMMLSREKRLKILGSVVDLGLDLYGTPNWKEEYYGNIDLNMAYIDKSVYSIKHNQEIYNSSKIGISVSHLQAVSGFPWRIMDIMASNACLVSDYHGDFAKLFGDIPIPVYESESEAHEVCKCLLMDESRRKDIVLQCQEIINTKYRFKHLLSKLEQYSGVIMHT